MYRPIISTQMLVVNIPATLRAQKNAGKTQLTPFVNNDSIDLFIIATWLLSFASSPGRNYATL
jgi:hypothetical protein